MMIRKYVYVIGLFAGLSLNAVTGEKVIGKGYKARDKSRGDYTLLLSSARGTGFDVTYKDATDGTWVYIPWTATLDYLEKKKSTLKDLTTKETITTKNGVEYVSILHTQMIPTKYSLKDLFGSDYYQPQAKVNVAYEKAKGLSQARVAINLPFNKDEIPGVNIPIFTAYFSNRGTPVIEANFGRFVVTAQAGEKDIVNFTIDKEFLGEINSDTQSITTNYRETGQLAREQL
jgi:hypothetical protein